MNWDAMGAIGEVIGAITVVASLIYLAGQIRHTNRLANSNSLQSVLQSEMNFASIIIENADIWERLIQGDTFTDNVERRKAMALYNLYLIDTANRFFQHKAGYLQNQTWEGRLETLHDYVKWPMFEMWRNSMGAIGHSTDFLKLIDSIREEETGT